ncbi:twin-arginine translocation protein, TatB subunit [Rhizorhabdus wittichii RW1]|uniref:Twin-arginine translocation protein, TatB subunit n=1 Tax=Rhizorhabdus wittichii (strain DSM 6014 / CCUG 31198 / JCM 15750 / NBRC 105917 / EY 4224 / RW1) TaxID=392499 RepID=A0A9J9HES4_RHIWR|nr:twin-arginine translocation protein, TatB subunit [Rhizorhabdus wittichii RW1]
MLDVAPTELLLVALVALVVIGPKDLPRAMRFVGQWVARARGVARHFRSGIDEMIRQAELEEMEKKWKAENERIMREHPPQPQPADGEMLPLGAPQDGGGTEMTSTESTTQAAAEGTPPDRPATSQQP